MCLLITYKASKTPAALSVDTDGHYKTITSPGGPGPHVHVVPMFHAELHWRLTKVTAKIFRQELNLR